MGQLPYRSRRPRRVSRRRPAAQPKPLPEHPTTQERLAFYARTMRRAPTASESALWDLVRSKRLGVRFERQVPLFGSILDFYCRERRVAVEVDGSSHRTAAAARRDAHRDRKLGLRGIVTLRVSGWEVMRNPNAVRGRIEALLRARGSERQSAYRATDSYAHWWQDTSTSGLTRVTWTGFDGQHTRVQYSTR